MMQRETWQIVWFTLLMSGCATVLVTPFAVILGWCLARGSWRGKTLVETAVSLPLVLPPVATGLILLKLFGRRGPLGAWLDKTGGIQIVFTWKAVLLALAVMSFPLVVRTLRLAFEQVPVRYEQVARTLGAPPLRVFLRITLPLAWRGVIGGMVLGFARSLGEFGATIVVAGAIPGKTATLSVSIFNLIQLGQDGAAMNLLLVSVLFAFGSLWLSEVLARRKLA